MEWPEDPCLPPCFNTHVADATLLYGAYCSLDVLFFSEARVESHSRFNALRAHLPRDMGEVPVHPTLCEFKQRFRNLCAHFGYTRAHHFSAHGDAVGDPAPLDAPATGGSLPPPPPSCTLGCAVVGALLEGGVSRPPPPF